MIEIWTGYEWEFLLKISLALIFGYAIGLERESRGRVAGVSTHCLVIAGAMLFTFLSFLMDPGSPTRIAAQVVTGVGFLCGGIILKAGGYKVSNLTTAASLWFAGAIGMSLGFGWYTIAFFATVYSFFIPRVPFAHGMK